MIFDWRFYLFLFIVLTSIINLIIMLSVKFNDMKHISEDVKELKLDLKSYIKKLYSLAQRVARLEGKTK